MSKIVVCTGCKRSFRVEGTQGTFKQVADRVTCPYCKEPNEVLWSPDGIYKAVPLYSWERTSD